MRWCGTCSLVVQEKLVEYVAWLMQDHVRGGHLGATHSAPALTIVDVIP